MADAPPLQLVVATFDDEKSAGAALEGLRQARRDRMIEIEDAAVVRKDHHGKLHIRETADMGGTTGAAIGGVAGAAIGLIGGVALAVPAIVGGLIGGLSAKLSDSGFDSDQLEQLGAKLEPGSSAIIAVVEHDWVDDARNAIRVAATDLVAAVIDEYTAAELETHLESAYSALIEDGHIPRGEIELRDPQAGGGVVVEDGNSAPGSEYHATDDGVVVTPANRERGRE